MAADTPWRHRLLASVEWNCLPDDPVDKVVRQIFDEIRDCVGDMLMDWDYDFSNAVDRCIIAVIESKSECPYCGADIGKPDFDQNEYGASWSNGCEKCERTYTYWIDGYQIEMDERDGY